MKLLFALLLIFTIAHIPPPPAVAQDAPEFQPPPPPVASPQVSAEGTVTFRLRAASATAVQLESPDIPGMPFGSGLAMTRGEEGVWHYETAALAPGAYRYSFGVDGVRVVDPVNTSTSTANSTVWSLVTVPGSEWFDTRDVPHGAVAEVTYHSSSLGRTRQMHVYTPPGYAAGAGDYPVFYLLHGATDADDSWSTVGRAGFILDNLIAAGQAVPMIVVMPHGHTGPFVFGGPPDAFARQMEEFVTDFTSDIRPYIETHYRVRAGRANRALAGLSMGGAQTLEVAVAQMQDFAYLGVFSSGVFSINPMGPAPDGPTWEEQHQDVLDDPALKDGLELVWFATGKDDFLLQISRGTVEALRKHGFEVVYEETEGGHTWLNWRDYLRTFVPLLFQ